MRNEWWTKRIGAAEASIAARESESAQNLLGEMADSLTSSSMDQRLYRDELKKLRGVLSSVRAGQWDRAQERFTALAPDLP